MAQVADHLSIEELEVRYRSCADACSARHYQMIWLLAQGHTIAEGFRDDVLCATLDRGIAGALQRFWCGCARRAAWRAQVSARIFAASPERQIIFQRGVAPAARKSSYAMMSHLQQCGSRLEQIAASLSA